MLCWNLLKACKANSRANNTQSIKETFCCIFDTDICLLKYLYFPAKYTSTGVLILLGIVLLFCMTLVSKKKVIFVKFTTTKNFAAEKVYFHRYFDFSGNCFAFLCETDFREIINFGQIDTKKNVYYRKERFLNSNEEF